jgi:hypothetical protein
MANTTQTTLVARKIMIKTGKGSVLFNDKLIDGRRSLKVWGWSEGEYKLAKKKLKKKGCDVTLVRFKSFSHNNGGRKFQTRLHVTETV